MHRIDAPDATSDHRFTEGNPTIPEPATTVTADWLNAVQEEIVAVLAAAKVTPDKANNAQLAAAIAGLIAEGAAAPGHKHAAADITSGTLTVGRGGTGASDAATARKNLGIVLNDTVTSTSKTQFATANAVKTAYDKAAAAGLWLCEFYFFRHPTLRPGFQPAQGGLLANAATLYPEAWAYLQTNEGQKLCKTEAEWQALTTATWATLADGAKVGWDGIGGAQYYAPNTATGALRLPDLHGMYAEAARFDTLGVGDAHGDGIREITGSLRGVDGGGVGAFVLGSKYTPQVTYGTGLSPVLYTLAASRVVPTAPVNQPRAWGALACVYLGTPR